MSLELDVVRRHYSGSLREMQNETIERSLVGSAAERVEFRASLPLPGCQDIETGVQSLTFMPLTNTATLPSSNAEASSILNRLSLVSRVSSTIPSSLDQLLAPNNPPLAHSVPFLALDPQQITPQIAPNAPQDPAPAAFPPPSPIRSRWMWLTPLVPLKDAFLGISYLNIGGIHALPLFAPNSDPRVTYRQHRRENASPFRRWLHQNQYFCFCVITVLAVLVLVTLLVVALTYMGTSKDTGAS